MSQNEILCIKIDPQSVAGWTEREICDEYGVVKALKLDRAMDTELTAIVSREDGTVLAASVTDGILKSQRGYRIVGRVLEGTLTGTILDIGTSRNSVVYIQNPGLEW